MQAKGVVLEGLKGTLRKKSDIKTDGTRRKEEAHMKREHKITACIQKDIYLEIRFVRSMVIPLHVMAASSIRLRVGI